MRSRESGDSTQPPRRRESATIRNLQLPMRRDRSLSLSAIVDTRSDHSREGTRPSPTITLRTTSTGWFCYTMTTHLFSTKTRQSREVNQDEAEDRTGYSR